MYNFQAKSEVDFKENEAQSKGTDNGHLTFDLRQVF